jgi:hypothetical protein
VRCPHLNVHWQLLRESKGTTYTCMSCPVRCPHRRVPYSFFLCTHSVMHYLWWPFLSINRHLTSVFPLQRMPRWIAPSINNLLFPTVFDERILYARVRCPRERPRNWHMWNSQECRRTTFEKYGMELLIAILPLDCREEGARSVPWGHSWNGVTSEEDTF